MHSTHTAVLYFTRSIKADAFLKKGLSAHFSEKQAIIRKLDAFTFSQAKKSQFPVIIKQEHQLSGNSFGEKIAQAFEEVFAAGFEHVIAITNDCPTLYASHIDKAGEYLRDNAFVLGPAKDGGLYLLGIQKHAFDRKKIESLGWQSKELSTSFKENFNAQTLLFLEEKQDVDENTDLLDFLHSSGFWHKLKGVFLSILASKAVYYQRVSSIPDKTYIVLPHSLRAPPVA